MFRFGFFLLLKSHKRFINKRANAKFLSVFLTRIKFHFYGREWCYMLFDDGFNHLTNNIKKIMPVSIWSAGEKSIYHSLSFQKFQDHRICAKLTTRTTYGNKRVKVSQVV